jgi:FixJ family two-component response regulator
LRHVAVIDDDPLVLRAIGRVLKDAGYEVSPFLSAENFLAYPGRFDCVLLDVQLPGMSGVELEPRIRASEPLTAVVFFTAQDDAVRAQIARDSRRVCLPKPTDHRALLAAIERAIQVANTRDDEETP